MRHPNDKCYVCDNSATGSVFGQAVCAPCKKFVWRHRFSNLSTLRCEVGFGPQRNKCDLTRKRSCTKCRLRRSIDGNKRLRQFLEKNLGQGACDGKNESAANDHHMQAMDKLRGFLATKRMGSSQQASTSSIAENSISDEASSSASSPYGGSILNLSCQSQHTRIAHHNNCNSDVKERVPVTPPPLVPVEFSAQVSPTVTSETGAFSPFHLNAADSRSPYEQLLLALNFVQPIFPIFTSRFLEIFNSCQQEDYCHLFLLAVKANGGSLGSLSETLVSMVSNKPSSPPSTTEVSSKLDEIMFGLNVYFSIATSSNNADSKITPTAVLDVIRTNTVFQHLANVPMQIALSNFLSNNPTFQQLGNASLLQCVSGR